MEVDLSSLSSAQFIKRLSTMNRRDPSTSLAWAIGNALSIVDVKGFEEQIIELCRNRKYGTARQMVVLGRCHSLEGGGGSTRPAP